MGINNSLGNVQRQEQKITAALIQGLNMLSLPCQEVYSYLVELAMENPMLNIPDPPGEIRYENVGGDESENPWALKKAEYKNYYDSPSSYSGVYPESGEDEFDPFYKAGVAFEVEGLEGSLRLQLSMQKLSDIERAIGEEIIGNIDERGYFVGNLNTICLLFYQDLAVGEKVLGIIQDFYPRGVGARNLAESLCLQVSSSFKYAEIAKKIIQENLQAVCDGNVLGCARKYGISVEAVNFIFSYIRTLDPRPGYSESSAETTNYTVPDIIIENRNGELVTYLYKDTDSPLSISEEYLELMKASALSAEDRTYLKTCLNEARSLIHSIDVRRQTMYKLAMSLISFQADFFRYGADQIAPMTMKNLADQMGVNVSTISRLVKDKYISTPWGIFPIKYFFSRAVASSDGEEISTTIMEKMEVIAEMAEELECLDILVGDTATMIRDFWAAHDAFHTSMESGAKSAVEVNITVPSAVIGEMVEYAKALGEEKGVKVMAYAHVGSGGLHIHAASEDAKEVFKPVAEELTNALLSKCIELGGSVRGEYGIGYSKKELYRAELGEDAYAALVATKSALDANNILNPGKVCTD